MKRIPKEHTGSFFLEPALLELLDTIATLEGQSRGVIVERAVRYFLIGGENEKRWEKSKCAYTAKKKVHVKAPHHRAFKSARQKGTDESKRVLANVSLFGSPRVCPPQSLRPSLDSRTPRLPRTLEENLC